ncbi:hypothetical protein PG993_012060 [Apiospora rasikravindrae]|uniref:Myb-like domain-containing protein n=1 Tax=Apiospora rasikravindrae TaxID=990691 RepID=A0ABR1S1E1_9PEZI
MAPSTRSKAAAAAGISSSARQTRSTRKTRQAAEPKEEQEPAESSNAAAHPDTSAQSAQAPQDESSDEEQTSADPVKRDAHPITRRYAPRESPGAKTIILGSEAGLEDIDHREGSPMLGHESFISPPKRRINRSALRESQEAEPYAPQPATGGDGDPSSEVVQLLEYVISDVERQTSELYNCLILLNSGDQPELRIRALRVQVTSAFSALKSSQSSFINEDDLFIDVVRFHRVLKDHEDQDFANHAYQVICRSNLVMLLTYLSNKTYNSQRRQEIMNKVANNFPWVFDFAAPSEDEEGVAKQIDLSFSLRCCRLASLIDQERQEDPYVLATRVFCEEKVESRKAAKQAISQGPYKPLTSPQTPDLSTEEYQARMAALDVYLSEKKREKTQSRMEAEYSLEKLALTLGDWAQTRCEELFALRRPEVQDENDTNSATHKEAQNNDEDNRSKSSSLMVAQDDGEPELQSEESDSDSEIGQQIRRTDALAGKSIVDDSDDDSEVGEPIIRKPGVDATKSHLLDDEAFDEDESSVAHGTPARPASSHAAPISNQQLRDNIRAMDPDEVLKLISSSRPNGSAPPANSLPAVHRGHNPKRSVPPMEYPDEDDDSDPFEANSMLNKGKDRIAAKRTAAVPLPAKRRRLSKPSPAAGPSRRSPTHTIPSRSRFEGSDGEPDEHVSRKGLRPADVATLSQRAKETKGAIRHLVTRPPQKRIPWSDEDTLKLIDDIAEYGCSWSTLTEVQRYEVERNQQQIRDKARNTKVSCLEGRAPLWAGFDAVVLGYKEKQRLIKLGLNPDRMEEDFEIGEDGKKILTNVFL